MLSPQLLSDIPLNIMFYVPWIVWPRKHIQVCHLYIAHDLIEYTKECASLIIFPPSNKCTKCRRHSKDNNCTTVVDSQVGATTSLAG